MYFKAYFQTLPLGLTSWENLKKTNYRPPQVWFILYRHFRSPENTMLICANNSSQLKTPWDLAAVMPPWKETH